MNINPAPGVGVCRANLAGAPSSTVWRTMRADAIGPWLHQMWIFPRDPHFATKAARALDLYARVFEGGGVPVVV